RKRRLDHLSLEQKLQRKKLKNRVAAQTSRDRKKARLDDLEAEVKALREKNEALTLHCHNLQLEKMQLATENQDLRQKLSSHECNHQTHDVCCSTQFEPAEFSMDPLLQGQALQWALGPVLQVLTVYRILLYCHLSQISSIILMEMYVCLTWMNWHRVYSEMLQKKWMQSTDKPVQSYKMVGSSPKGMETSRELITSSPVLKCSEQCKTSSASIPNIEDSSVCLVPNQKDTCDSSSESVFGTYNESTHTITIVVPCEDVCVEDAVQEVVTSDTVSVVPAPMLHTTLCKEESVENPVSPCSIRTLDSLSPAPSSPHLYDNTESSMKVEPPLSDCGYESLDSPQNEISGTELELMDIWSESFSHLFPTLM
ncbi:hypothetical protein L798_10320, partial [Zootermopsis nevadensis]